MVPRIREQVPDFELDVLYGMLNWEAAAKTRNNPQELAFIQKIKDMLKQPGVNYVGRVNKQELAVYQKRAKVLLYPCVFSETFFIGGVEQGLAKNAVVTTPYAGLLTTLGDTPSYIKGPASVPVEQWAMTPEYQDAFVAEAVKLLTDESYRQACANKVHDKVKGYTWQAAAQTWYKEWKLIP
jgi:glycosyltransferase involved in cell wall biosynthesis